MNTSVTVTESCSATDLTFNMAHKNYSSLITNYGADELMMCWDYKVTGSTESFLWKISTAGSSGTGTVGITSNSGVYSDFDSLCGTNENLPPIMWCSRANVVSFYVDDDASDGVGPGTSDHPVLMMDLNYTYPSSGQQRTMSLLWMTLRICRLSTVQRVRTARTRLLGWTRWDWMTTATTKAIVSGWYGSPLLREVRERI